MTGSAALSIDVLFTEVFGTSSPVYLPWGQILQDCNPGKYIGMTAIPDTEAEAYSWMGTPVIGMLIFDDSKQYSIYNPGGPHGTMNMASFSMPYAVVVDFSRLMNYPKTKVLGVHGTVKEVYGFDDRKINIRGFYIADKSRGGYGTVAEQMNALCKFRRVTETVGVTGNIFNNKEIYSIAIGNISSSPI